jgi:hypothetical protein
MRGRAEIHESSATTTTRHDQTERRQGSKGHAVVASRGRAEGALGGGLRTVAVGRCHRAVAIHGSVRGHVDVERKLCRKLICARLQVIRVDELTVAEQRAALVVVSQLV